MACSFLLQVPPGTGTPAGPAEAPRDRVAGETGPISISSETELATAAATYGWPGNGSASNPYVISGLEINGSGSSYCLRLRSCTNPYVVVRDNRFFGTTVQSSDRKANAGIALDSCRRITFSNNTIEDNLRNGIYSYQSNVAILNNTLRGAYGDIYVDGGSPTITGNRFESAGISVEGYPTIEWNVFSGGGAGIVVSTWTPKSVSNNTFSHMGYGIIIRSGTTTRYEHNTFANCTTGISIEEPSISVAHNAFTDCPSGISIRESGAKLVDNTLVRAGITFDSTILQEATCRSHTIGTTNTVGGRPVLYLLDGSDVTVRPDTYGEVILVGCSDVLLTETTIEEEFWLGCYYSDVVTITRNRVETGSAALWRTYYATDVWIANNTLHDVDLALTSPDPLVLSNNTLDGGTVYMDGEASASISNNTIVSRGETALTVYLNLRAGVSIRDNNITVEAAGNLDYTVTMAGFRDVVTLERNELWGAPIQDRWFYYTDMAGQILIDDSNTLNGRPVLYLDSASGATVSGSYGEVLVYNSSGVTVDGLSFGTGDGGVYAGRSGPITVTRCTFEGLKDGAVNLLYCVGTEIVDNLFKGANSRVRMLECNNVGTQTLGNVTGNYFLDLAPDTAAITLESSRLRSISGNYLSDIAGYGIYASSAAVASASDNELHNCTQRACTGSTAGTVWDHNSLIDCPAGLNGSFASSGSTAKWDDGSEGNYWSNYELRYPAAKKVGLVWDTPYVVSDYPALKDSFPLVKYTDRIAPRVDLLCNATALPNTVEAFEAVAIDNQGVTRYGWSFDGGATWTYDAGARMDHTFPASGNFTVIVRALDAAGNADSASRVVAVLDNIPPVADAGDDVTVLPGTTVTLDGSRSSDDRGIVSYNWTFEYDGEPVALHGATVDFTFALLGVYDVTLNVSDAAGNSGLDVVEVAVADEEPPVAVAGEDVEVPQGTTLELDGSASTDNWRIESWNWTVLLQGGNVAHYDTPVASHTFVDVGVYLVTLRVTDPVGLWDEASFNVTVKDVTPPVAVAGVDVEVPQGTVLRLDGSNSTDNWRIASWEWTVTSPAGTAVRYTGPRASHAFEDVGVHVVTLRVTDASGNWDEASFNVTAIDVTSPVAVAVVSAMVGQGEPLELDGSASTDNVGIVTWQWTVLDADGAHPLGGMTASYAFREAGTFHVTLNVTDAAGNWAVASRTVTVEDTTPPVVDLGDARTVDLGAVLTPDIGNSSDNVGIVGVEWDVTAGMGIEPAGAAAFRFTRLGTCWLGLALTDAAGNEATGMLLVNVVDREPPRAEAGPDITAIDGSSVALNGSGSTDNAGIATYTWRCAPSGLERSGERVAWRPPGPGTYVVTLTVTDASNNTAEDDVTITYLSRSVYLHLGPFLDEDVRPVANATVRVALNGTVYTGSTDATGRAAILVPRADLAFKATVVVTKPGWQRLGFDTGLDEEGRPLVSIPPMTREEAPGLGPAILPVAVAVVAVAAAALAAVLWSRRTRAGNGRGAGPPPPPLPPSP